MSSRWGGPVVNLSTRHHTVELSTLIYTLLEMMDRHSVRQPSLEQDWPSQSTRVETCGRRCRGEAEKIINIPRHQQDAGLEPVHVGFSGTQSTIVGFSLIAAVWSRLWEWQVERMSEMRNFRVWMRSEDMTRVALDSGCFEHTAAWYHINWAERGRYILKL